MSSLQNLAKCEKSLEYKERIKKKGVGNKIVASTKLADAKMNIDEIQKC
jgi:hypothetical protein